jgi:hypothetical protein
MTVHWGQVGICRADCGRFYLTDANSQCDATLQQFAGLVDCRCLRTPCYAYDFWQGGAK